MFDKEIDIFKGMINDKKIYIFGPPISGERYFSLIENIVIKI
jgi:hypothetical protein